MASTIGLAMSREQGGGGEEEVCKRGKNEEEAKEKDGDAMEVLL